jgi:hypothetical protein
VISQKLFCRFGTTGSADEECKILLWMKNGQSVGVVPQLGEKANENINVSCSIQCSLCSVSCIMRYGKKCGDVIFSDINGT